MSTTNARRESMAKAWTFGPAWSSGRRCIIPALAFDEPYYPAGSKKSIAWRFTRADGELWALAGLWSEWLDPATGELVPNFT
jgi:putative SOS response-associated peptidase YedK